MDSVICDGLINTLVPVHVHFRLTPKTLTKFLQRQVGWCTFVHCWTGEHLLINIPWLSPLLWIIVHLQMERLSKTPFDDRGRLDCSIYQRRNDRVLLISSLRYTEDLPSSKDRHRWKFLQRRIGGLRDLRTPMKSNWSDPFSNSGDPLQNLPLISRKCPRDGDVVRSVDARNIYNSERTSSGTWIAYRGLSLYKHFLWQSARWIGCSD